MRLKSSSRSIYQANTLNKRIFVDKSEIINWVDAFYSWIFCIQKEYLEYTVFEMMEIELKESLKSIIEIECMNEKVASDVSEKFFSKIPLIYQTLKEDLNAVLEFDPAARSINDVLLSYPGFFAISVYRISHELWNNKVWSISRLISEYAHGKTGIDIHPGAVIGKRFFIDHGTGVVIGETTKIGDDVIVYQGVTLGALSVSKNKAEKKRHPTIEDNVLIYSNATILGGETVIGKGSIIGGNVWITTSIPTQSLVYNNIEITIKTKKEFPKPINFSI